MTPAKSRVHAAAFLARFGRRGPCSRPCFARTGGCYFVGGVGRVGAAAIRAPHLTAVLRHGERVTPLELFFDLVFVLAITQCTALMAGEPTWHGLAKGMLVLGVLWWSWVGYAWLTSVVDPEQGTVRLVMFASMAALLVAALCVPKAFGSSGLLFACAYAAVLVDLILLFLAASRDDPALRRSVSRVLGSTAIGAALLVAASFTGGAMQAGL